MTLAEQISDRSDICRHFHNTKNVCRQNLGNFFHFNFGYEKFMKI